MAIDPSIPLAIRPVQIQPAPLLNPLQVTSQVLSLRGLMMQNQMAQMQLQQAQQAMQEDAALAEMWKRIYGTNPPASVATPTPPNPATSQVPGTGSLGPLAPTAPTTPFFPIPELQPSPTAPDTTSLAPSVGPTVPSATVVPTGTVSPVQGIPGFTGVPGTSDILPPGLNFGQMMAVAPHRAPGIITNFVNMQKAQSEMLAKQTEANLKTAERLGQIGNSVLQAKDPAAAAPGAIMQAQSEGVISPQVARALLARPFNADEWQQFVNRGQSVKDTHEAALNALKAENEARANASRSISLATDQTSYTRWLAEQPASIQRALGPTYSPNLKAAIQGWGIPAADTPDVFAKNLSMYGQRLAGVWDSGAEARQKVIADMPSDIAAVYQGANSRQDVLNRSLKPEQAFTITQQARTQQANQEGKLRDDFTQVTKDFRTMRDAYGRTQAIITGPQGGIADVGLIFSYMKMLDPGSVVREGEFATASNAGGVVETIRNLYNRLLTGERLPEKTRNDMISQTKRLYNQAAQDHQQTVNQYTEMAKRMSLDPQNVIVDFTSTAGQPKYQTIERVTPGAPPPSRPVNAPPERTSTGAVQAAPPGSTAETDQNGKQVWFGPDGRRYELPPEPVINVGGVTVTDPRGKVHTFRTQREADAFKQAAGIP